MRCWPLRPRLRATAPASGSHSPPRQTVGRPPRPATGSVDCHRRRSHHGVEARDLVNGRRRVNPGRVFPIVALGFQAAAPTALMLSSKGPCCLSRM